MGIIEWKFYLCYVYYLGRDILRRWRRTGIGYVGPGGHGWFVFLKGGSWWRRLFQGIISGRLEPPFGGRRRSHGYTVAYGWCVGYFYCVRFSVGRWSNVCIGFPRRGSSSTQIVAGILKLSRWRWPDGHIVASFRFLHLLTPSLVPGGSHQSSYGSLRRLSRRRRTAARRRTCLWRLSLSAFVVWKNSFFNNIILTKIYTTIY